MNVRTLSLLAALTIANPAFANKSHCGPNAFSPQAPQWVCEAPDNPPRSVPEPGTYVLVGMGLLLMRLLLRKRVA